MVEWTIDVETPSANTRSEDAVDPRRPTLPGPCGPSTIGAEGLNVSVRRIVRDTVREGTQ
jgi:hypothetical protein